MEVCGIAVLAAIFLLPLAGLASETATEAKTVVANADNGKEITLHEGAVFEVRLEQASGTGYQWQLIDLDKTHLKVLEFTETSLTERIGGPLLSTWKIKAVKTGQTDLKILLYRPWEGLARAADSYQIKIDIG